MALITAEETVQIAFNRQIDASLIKDADIDVAEWKYIKPLLTDDLYEDVIANESSYTNLLKFIKRALAFYLKAIIIDDIAYELGDRGGFQLQADDAVPITNEGRRAMKQSSLMKANELASIALNYVIKQEYEKYERGATLRSKQIGGFLIENDGEEITTTPPTLPSGEYEARVYLDGSTIKLQYKTDDGWQDTDTSWSV